MADTAQNCRACSIACAANLSPATMCWFRSIRVRPIAWLGSARPPPIPSVTRVILSPPLSRRNGRCSNFAGSPCSAAIFRPNREQTLLGIVGYWDRFSARPGDEPELKVSIEDGASNFHIELVRLICGDDGPSGPGFKTESITSDVNGGRPG